MPTRIFATPDPEANALCALELWQQYQDHSIYRNQSGGFIVLLVTPYTHIPSYWQLVSPEEIESHLLHLELEPEEDIPCQDQR